MNIQNESDQSSLAGDEPNGDATSIEKPVPITPADFFQSVAVNHPEGLQAIVTWGVNNKPNDHNWCKSGPDFGARAASKAKGRNPAYFSMAAFNSAMTSRFEGRTTPNVVGLRVFGIDVEGSADKHDKPGGEDKGYRNGPLVMEAVRDFVQTTGATPNYLVSTGSGGAHLYYVLDNHITPTEWLGRAKSLVALAGQLGLKIDAQCTTDAARIMRAPGSLHQKTGKEVKAYRLKVEPYSLDEWDQLTCYEAGAVSVPALGAPGGKYSLKVNGDVLGNFPKFSYQQAAKQCGAMRKAALRQGKDTDYPIWILAVRSAALSIEGREFAQSISDGHEEYDEATTDKQIDSLTGGPAGCDAWADAFSAGGPCESCEYRGKIKNPAVQLGAVVDTTPPGREAATESEMVVGWTGEMNSRFALVRVGSKVSIVDFQTPSMTARGVIRSFGFLDLAGFRSMHNGRFSPIEKAGDKQRPLSDAWLAHSQRRQYEGLVFAPGEKLSPDMLNLWQGFGVEPMVGDVSLWLDVLAALVPNELERLYVLRWIAWKIQYPGGVPDTVLIFKGAKGTGKNSLFDPIILLFGRHAMLTGEPEMIVGRFNIHLMYLSFAVLDEAVFVVDPRQGDKIKVVVTAKTMHYEQKGMDPVQGVNRCAYVILTNHEDVWPATRDERRATIIESGQALRGNLKFWTQYHEWVEGVGPAALLHYLQAVDLTGFNPREIPKGEALRKQVEQTALRSPAAAWWHQCLTEGAVRWRDGQERIVYLDEAGETEIDRSFLRMSYEQSAAARGRASSNWAAVSKQLIVWAGVAGIRKTKSRSVIGREWHDVLPSLQVLRSAFTASTQVEVSK